MNCDVDHEKMMELISDFKKSYRNIATEKCKNDDEMFVFIHEITTYSSLLLISLFDDMDIPTDETFEKFMRRTHDKYKEEFANHGCEQRTH